MKKLILLFLFLLCLNISFGIRPDTNYVALPKDFGLLEETNYITTLDEVKIASWVLPSQIKDGNNITIIISYGDALNMSYWLGLAVGLTRQGFDVVTYDYRGFGKSDSFKINPKMLYYPEYVTDLKAVVDYAQQIKPSNKICLMGLSMGSVVSMLYFNNYGYKNISFYIGEGHVYSPNKVKEKLLSINKQVLLINDNIDWSKFYKKLNIPFLLFCANNDIVCDNDIIESMLKEIDKIEIKKFEGSHLSGFYKLNDEYLNEISKFILKYK